MTKPKPLKRIEGKSLYHYISDERIEGKNKHMRGDYSELWGDCSGLQGDFTGLKGNLNLIPMNTRKEHSDISYWAEA